MVARAVSLVDASDTIIVVTNPPILPYLALLVKHLTGCTLVLLIHDVYPEVLSATGVLPKDSYIVRWWHRASAVLYRQVDRIVTLGRDMTRLVENKLDETDGRCGGRSKVVRIPNWSENDIIEPQARTDNPVLQAHNLQDQFVVLYAGNHGRTHGIEHLAEAARRLDAAGEAVHFLFVGFGAKKDWLESYVASQGLSNVTSIRGISRSEQGDYLNACDLAVISFIPGMAGISVPSRTYNHMAAGKPILAAADESSELAEVVLEEKIGWRIAPGSPGDVADAVRYAASHPEECRTKGRRAARAAQTTYSFENVLSKYERLLATT
jgi:glycosyltransferase involved in cell wall biosynthesis